MRFNFRPFILTLLLCFSSLIPLIDHIIVSSQGSFHISQEVDGIWQEIFVEPYTTKYQTKNFSLQPQKNQIKIQINQKSVSYGDIEQVQLYACGQVVHPEYARYVDGQESILEDVLLDDHNVVVNHEKPVELFWNIPAGCKSDTVLTVKANEYESPEENAFRFPAWGTPSQVYPFRNNGSFDMDGLLLEVDGKIKPNYSPFWTAGTGHPSNKTLIYMRDDHKYVYVAVDILLDNTNEYGQDWIKILAKNSKTGGEREFRVDDFNSTYGKCAFGLTSKISYKHQTCEVKIPKEELLGNEIDFTLRYYGTGGAPTVSVESLVFDATTSDSTPTVSGVSRAEDGASALTGMGFGLADSQGASQGNIVSNYDGECIADDGVFDETTETFTCTTSALSPGGFRMFIRATNGSESGTNNTAIFTVTDSTAPSLSLTAITDPTTNTTPTLAGTSTDVSGTVANVQFQMDGTGGSWSACSADDGVFDEASETFTCTPPALSIASHTMYVRATDSNSNTTSGGSESTDTFTISASPTATPVPTNTPSATLSSIEAELPQIPQGQSEEVGGTFTPIKDSFTDNQLASVIVEPGTFTNDAYFSAQVSIPAFTNGLLQSPLTSTLPSSSGLLRTNTVMAGGNGLIGGILAIRQDCGLMWQVGGIQQMWFKTYPPKGSDKPAAIIIPELQSHPSIIALGYSPSDLIPPGSPDNPFNPSGLKLAHSLDGVSWGILSTSVVDTSNRTVAALHRVGGFYMIVAGCQNQRFIQPVVESYTLGASDEKLDVVEKAVNPVLDVIKPTVSLEPEKTRRPSLLQQGVKFIKGLLSL